MIESSFRTVPMRQCRRSPTSDVDGIQHGLDASRPLPSGIDVGLVTHIAAPASLRIAIEGEGGHAGARLMQGRKDALVAAGIGFASKQMIALLRDGSAGNAMVELALMLPFFAIMLIALFKFGLAVNNYLILQNAVSQGIYAVANNASDPTLTNDPCNLAYKTVSNVVASQFDPEKLNFSLTLNNPQTTFSGVGHSFSCAESQDVGKLHSVDADQPVSLTVTYPLDLNIIGYKNSQLSAIDASSTDLMSATAQQNVQVITP